MNNLQIIIVGTLISVALIEKAYRDSELSGKCYEAYVNLVLELERIKERVNDSFL